jgi:hypothetical protein
MISMEPSQQYDMLVQSLRLVAVSAEEQIASLPDFVSVTDEIVSGYGDAFLLVPQLERAGRIAAEAAGVLRRLDELFGSMPEDEALADAESLAVHPFWAEARLLATEALDKLGEEKRPPDFSATRWIPG